MLTLRTTNSTTGKGGREEGEGRGREGGREGEGRGYLGVPGRSEGEGRSLEGSRGGDGSGEGRGRVEASRLVDGSYPLLHLHHISVGGRKGRDITKRTYTIQLRRKQC